MQNQLAKNLKYNMLFDKYCVFFSHVSWVLFIALSLKGLILQIYKKVLYYKLSVIGGSRVRLEILSFDILSKAILISLLKFFIDNLSTL